MLNKIRIKNKIIIASVEKPSETKETYITKDFFTTLQKLKSNSFNGTGIALIRSSDSP